MKIPFQSIQNVKFNIPPAEFYRAELSAMPPRAMIISGV